MTYRELLKIENPMLVDSIYVGGAKGCPGSYYDGAPRLSRHCHVNRIDCARCWDREAKQQTIKSPDAMLRMYLRDKRLYDDHTFVIMGRSGATGKTWLTNELRKGGLRAFEVTERLYNVLDYKDDKNHYILDSESKTILIILNTPFERKKPKKMTVSDIEKALGYNIEIVSEE